MKRSTTDATKIRRGDENFSFGSGIVYADLADYVSTNRTFDILAIAFEPGRGYEGRNRWSITVKAADRESELLTLGSNPGRDKELQTAQTHLEGGNAIKNKRLRLSGNAYYLVDADR